MSSEAEIEKEIQRKGLNAPRLTPETITALIIAEQYYVFPGTVKTVCALTLRNGFVVIGESAPASPENFDENLGRKIAFDDARKKIWPLEGYALRTRLAAKEQIGQAAGQASEPQLQLTEFQTKVRGE